LTDEEGVAKGKTPRDDELAVRLQLLDATNQILTITSVLARGRGLAKIETLAAYCIRRTVRRTETAG
jgi:hypothetical protein